MISFQEYREFCFSLPFVTEDYPFDKDTLVFRVGGKIFALSSVSLWYEGNPRINIKATPEDIQKQREIYASLIPGYHMNKKHWNTILAAEGELSREEIFSLIENSYFCVRKSLSQRVQKSLA